MAHLDMTTLHKIGVMHSLIRKQMCNRDPAMAQTIVRIQKQLSRERLEAMAVYALAITRIDIMMSISELIFYLHGSSDKHCRDDHSLASIVAAAAENNSASYDAAIQLQRSLRNQLFTRQDCMDQKLDHLRKKLPRGRLEAFKRNAIRNGHIHAGLSANEVELYLYRDN